MSLLRAFIAVEIPQRSHDAIERQIAPLRQILGNDLIRWVPSENMHLTLKFLGEAAAAHLNFLKQMISQVAGAHAPFDLQIGGLGCYPNRRAPRVIWVGIHAPPALAALHKNIEAGASRLGYDADERAFSPHLTIGRLRQNANPADLPKARDALNATQLGAIDIARVDAVHLFKSDLTNGGSIYTKLFSAPLKKRTQKSPDF